VEFDITPEAESNVNALSFRDKEHFTKRIGMYIGNYFEMYLDTKVGVKEFRRPTSLVP